MKKILSYINTGVADLIKNKGRTFLTSLGVVIGVYSVVLLLSLGEGLKIYITQQFESLGSNLIFVLPGKIEGANSQRSINSGAKFTYADFKKLKSSLNNSVVVPTTNKNITINTQNKQEKSSLLGSTKEIFTIYNIKIKSGRSFSKNEELSGRKVVVLGPKIAEDLFKNKNPIKKTVKINGLRFTVVGVAEEKGGGGLGGPDFDRYVYTPYKTLQLMTNDKSFFSFYIKAYNKEVVDATKARVKKILLKNYKDEDFSVTTQEELLSIISTIIGTINGVLVGIATISLLVGGVGITNIMYVTVNERTKEIGVRRAVGATQKNILLQFVTQSILLTTFGGGIGLLLALLTTLVVKPFFPATITLLSVILAFFVSFIIGVVFGVLPAQKAAKMSPVEAIRYE